MGRRDGLNAGGGGIRGQSLISSPGFLARELRCRRRGGGITMTASGAVCRVR